MKIIDLLNKIANNEEVPKKIKYNDEIFIAKGNALQGFVDYVCEEDEYAFNHYVRYENLNDEVEILEEKKIPEKLDLQYKDIIYNPNFKANILMYCDNLQFKINEIIDYLDYLKSKGE